MTPGDWNRVLVGRSQVACLMLALSGPGLEAKLSSFLSGGTLKCPSWRLLSGSAQPMGFFGTGHSFQIMILLSRY